MFLETKRPYSDPQLARTKDQQMQCISWTKTISYADVVFQHIVRSIPRNVLKFQFPTRIHDMHQIIACNGCVCVCNACIECKYCSITKCKIFKSLHFLEIIARVVTSFYENSIRLMEMFMVIQSFASIIRCYQQFSRNK